ncbi:pentapeptide repeat-containing protein [Desmonostoc muscorum CCALA 125]|nr:pentapeptide repeat-containing protein [Desmonostoc muscorum CCALA 125]
MSKIKGYILNFLSSTKILISTGAIISIIMVIFLPKLSVNNARLSDEKRIELENSNRSTLVQFLGGLFFFSTAYFTWRNLQISEKNLKLTEESFRQNLKNTQDQQITERFLKAIELLESENIHVRIGAIYALERIAKDSDKDYLQIAEILTAYVRENSRYDKKTFTTRVPIDIHAVMTVLTRLTKDCGRDKKYYLDLSGSNLSRINCQGANFQCINLSNTYLWWANLEFACLEGANLEGANLYYANLQSANLSYANLKKTKLGNANLANAVLRDADLQKVIVPLSSDEAEAVHVDLVLANLEGADLRGANLREAFLNNACLQGAKLERANFEGAWLSGNNIEIIEENLLDANLNDANLEAADFRNARIKPEQIKTAKNWEKANYSPEFSKKLGLPLEK